MIGQKKVLENIDILLENGNFPRFSIIVGETGFGKHELVKYIAKRMNIDYLLFDSKISDIRSFMDIANNQEESLIYVLQDGEDMALQTKNSILKIIEEVPSSAYIILLLSNTNNALTTILSRGFTFVLEGYSEEELVEYAKSVNVADITSVTKICTCPGDVNAIAKSDPKELVDFVEKVIDNIPIVALPNVMKVAKTIVDPNYPYSFNVVCNAFINSLYNKMKTASDTKKMKVYVEIAQIVGKYRRLALAKSSNIKYIADSMIMDMWATGG